MVDKVLFSHESEEWQTPKELYDRLNKVFEFDLDPCTTKDNPLGTKYYFTSIEYYYQDGRCYCSTCYCGFMSGDKNTYSGGCCRCCGAKTRTGTWRSKARFNRMVVRIE